METLRLTCAELPGTVAAGTAKKSAQVLPRRYVNLLVLPDLFLESLLVSQVNRMVENM